MEPVWPSLVRWCCVLIVTAFYGLMLMALLGLLAGSAWT